MSGSTPESEVVTISFNQLRAKLEEGFREMMVAIPEGDEPAIKLGYASGGQLFPIHESEMEALPLLRDFAKAAALLREVRRAGDSEIVRLMSEGGVAQALVSEDDSWYQLHIQ